MTETKNIRIGRFFKKFSYAPSYYPLSTDGAANGKKT